MPFIIYVIDQEGVSDRRESLREAHRAHLRAQGKKLLSSGALLSDDGKEVIGGLSILDTDSHIEAERFAHEEPYAIAGIRKTTEIRRWRKRWVDGEFKGDNV